MNRALVTFAAALGGALLSSACTQDFEQFRPGTGGSGTGGSGGSDPCANVSCDDDNPCTDDACVEGQCTHEAATVFSIPQVDGDCKESTCDGTELVDQPAPEDVPDDDGNSCTTEECDGTNPVHPPVDPGTPCNNGTDGVCTDQGVCSACNDATMCGTNTQCATYSCDNHECSVTYAVGTVISGDTDGDCMALLCVDGNPDPQMQPFDDPEDDNNACTSDTCDAGTPQHDPEPVGTLCNDNVFCNGPDTCGDGNGQCTVHAGDPCLPLNTTDNDCSGSCNEANDSCTANDPMGTACDDGAFCNGGDTCNASGQCTVHTGDPCLPLVTTDNDCSGSCNEATNSCTANDPVGTVCNDGTFCNGTDTCNASGQCSVHGGDPCLPLLTTDGNCSASCNEGSGDCTAPDPLGTPCNDGLYCTSGNGPDSCTAGVCGGANPCSGQDTGPSCDDSCNEVANNCTAADAGGTVCNENGTGSNGTCTGNLTEPNCSGD